MAVDPVGPVGITVPPPEDLPVAQSEVQPMPETASEQSAPLPSYQGASVDETA